MHVWYVNAGIEDTPEPVYTHCLEAKAEVRKSEAEAKAQKFFRGRGHNV